jgi:eukaryotic-like serine/threonine-protein kinase
MSCPSAQQLAKLAEGSTDAAGLAHIESCAACRDVLRIVRDAVPDDRQPDGCGAPVAGDTIGRYVVLRVVAQGGMGEVYLGYDPILDRNLALKLVRADRNRSASFAARLAREAQVLAKLAHSNVVRVFDAGTWRGLGYVAMEYLDGESVRAWAAASERSTAEILRVFVGAAHGIAAAHRLGVVHRDIKPDNILVGADGLGRIADFGLVAELARGSDDGAELARRSNDGAELPRDEHARLTDGRSAVGTMGYRAPEVVAGQRADARSDQWSLCAALCEMLLGALPASAQSIAPGARKLPATTLRALRRGCDPDPARRFRSVDELAAALEYRPRVARYVTAALLAGAAITVAALWPARQRDPLAHCDAEARDAVAVASVLRGDAFSRRFDVFGSAAGLRRAATERELQSYTTRLSASAVGACRAAASDSAAAALQRDCIADRRRELAALITVLERTDRAGLDQAPIAIAKLPDPGLCDDPGRRATIVPIAAAARIEATRIADEAAALRSRWLVGERGNLLAAARTLAERGERLGDATVATSTSELYGDFLGESGDIAGAIEANLTAANHAARAHDDRALAVRLIRAAGNAAVNLAFDRADALLASAEIMAQRVSDRAVVDLLDAAKVELAIQRQDGAHAVPLARGLVARLREHEDPDYFGAVFQLARALSAAHESQEAQRVARAALDEITASFGADHPKTIQFYTHLGKIALETSKLDEANQHLTRALDVARAAYGNDNLITGDAINNLAAVKIMQGRDDEGIELAKQGIAIGERLGSRRLHVAMSSLATVYLDRGNMTEGLALMQRSLALREELFGADSPELLRPLVVLGMSSADTKNLDGARRYWGRAVSIMNKMPSPPDFGVDLLRDLAGITSDRKAKRQLLADADALERRLAERAKLASKR